MTDNDCAGECGFPLGTESTGSVFYPGQEVALNQSLDDYLTRTPPHPFDGDELEVPDGEC